MEGLKVHHLFTHLFSRTGSFITEIEPHPLGLISCVSQATAMTTCSPLFPPSQLFCRGTLHSFKPGFQDEGETLAFANFDRLHFSFSGGCSCVRLRVREIKNTVKRVVLMAVVVVVRGGGAYLTPPLQVLQLQHR